MTNTQSIQSQMAAVSRANKLLPKCKACGGMIGTIPLSEADERHHFGHVLSEAERGYCSQRCQRAAAPQVEA